MQQHQSRLPCASGNRTYLHSSWYMFITDALVNLLEEKARSVLCKTLQVTLIEDAWLIAFVTIRLNHLRVRFALSSVVLASCPPFKLSPPCYHKYRNCLLKHALMNPLRSPLYMLTIHTTPKPDQAVRHEEVCQSVSRVCSNWYVEVRCRDWVESREEELAEICGEKQTGAWNER